MSHTFFWIFQNNNCSFIGIEAKTSYLKKFAYHYNNCSFIGIEAIINQIITQHPHHNNCSFIGIEALFVFYIEILFTK